MKLYWDLISIIGLEEISHNVEGSASVKGTPEISISDH